jgi:hypothetical protein
MSILTKCLTGNLQAALFIVILLKNHSIGDFATEFEPYRLVVWALILIPLGYSVPDFGEP